MPNPVRAALFTALFTFLTLFLGTATGWLTTAAEAVQNGTEFPSLTILASAAVSALFSALAGLANWGVRYSQERAGKGKPPVYVKAKSGGAAVPDPLGSLLDRVFMGYLRAKEMLSRYIPVRYSSTYVTEIDGTVYLCHQKWWQRLGTVEDPETGEVFRDSTIILKSTTEMVSVSPLDDVEEDWLEE